MSTVPSVVMILGPTASGKTDLAIRLAEQFDGEIVNADSMQIYRGMDIGTAKPSADEQRRVLHHLIDIVAPDVNFSAADFQREAAKAIDAIASRGKRVFIVGGTGLYLKALVQGLVDSPHGDEAIRNQLKEQALSIGNVGLLRLLSEYDPVTAARLHPNDQVRIIRALEVYLQTGRPISSFREAHGFGGSMYTCLKIGSRVERDELYRRIDRRVDEMLSSGFEAEVRALLARGFGPDTKAMRAIGYKEMSACIEGVYPPVEAVRLIKRNTRHYAKRQLTWFASDPEINWLEYPENFATICNIVIDFFAKGEAHAKSAIQYSGSVS